MCVYVFIRNIYITSISLLSMYPSTYPTVYQESKEMIIKIFRMTVNWVGGWYEKKKFKEASSASLGIFHFLSSLEDTWVFLLLFK